MRFSVNGPLTTAQSKDYLHDKILDHYGKYGFGLYAVIHKIDQRLIGYAGLIIQPIDSKEEIELGYRLDPRYWGKGLASEAACALCHYAFEHLKINQLISIIDPRNIRSIKVAERMGMVFWKEAIFHQTPVHIYILKK